MRSVLGLYSTAEPNGRFVTDFSDRHSEPCSSLSVTPCPRCMDKFHCYIAERPMLVWPHHRHAVVCLLSGSGKRWAQVSTASGYLSNTRMSSTWRMLVLGFCCTGNPGKYNPWWGDIQLLSGEDTNEKFCKSQRRNVGRTRGQQLQLDIWCSLHSLY